ncbi:MAG: LysR family transcriptional regulator [Gammaproteobacteria bacterium]|nr:LysR family transcriptional regulator [Gammaproteobacteria bacterium]MBU1416215.1 LysR family transcriptional regulator [Gammaproteobacteria bacterium]
MDNPLRRLPPLDALKGFDAAARHLSFTRAAAELSLTQSAISRQVQTLEVQLGVRLFVRGVRKLTLTAEGEHLHRAAAQALADLAEVCAGLRAGQRRPRVTVSAAISIAALWLVPRLGSFQERHPDVDVRLSADNRSVDLAREEVDIALRYGPPELMPPGAALLFDEVVFPVAAPAIAAAFPAAPTAADLAKVTLLGYTGEPTPGLDWSPWLVSLGLEKARPKALTQFNQYDQLIRAAADGQGIALGRGPLVRRLIEEGRLAPLMEARERVASRGYYLLRVAGKPRPEVEAFIAWLVEEAGVTR